MTWLYILLGIILFILLLMLIPIGFKASYTDEVKAVLLIGFIPIPVYPPKPKKSEKKKKPQKHKHEKPKEEKPKRKKEEFDSGKGHSMADQYDTRGGKAGGRCAEKLF